MELVCRFRSAANRPTPTLCSFTHPRTLAARLSAGLTKPNKHKTATRGDPSCKAAEDDAPLLPASDREVFQGHYGPWTIDPEDVAEVWSYRIGLTAAVAAFVSSVIICSSASDGATASEVPAVAAAWALNPLVLLGAAGLGVSLVQIHIYMTPVKRTLQALYALGLAGAAYLLLYHGHQPLPLLVAQQPWTVWFVGPAAAAVTGVAIKEGICYGKPEAAGIGITLPLMCLAHLSGVAPAQLEQLLLLTVCGLGLVFAARKYTQPIKDDIGDKSVFVHMKKKRQT